MTSDSHSREDQPAIREFTRPLSLLDSPSGCYAIAALLFAFGIAAFFIALSLGAGHLAQTAVSTPIIVALGLLYTGYRASWSPVKIFAGREGLVLIYTRGQRAIRWEELRWADKETSGLNQKEYLILFNERGRRDVIIGPAFPGFSVLADLVTARIAEFQPDGAPPVRLEPNWKQAAFLITIGVLFTALSIAVLLMGRQDLADGKRLAAEGVKGEGIVVRRFVARDGRTKRIEYEVTGAKGERATHDVEVTPGAWDQLKEGGTAPVVYVPAAPHISQLISGQASGRYDLKRPAAIYGLPIALLLFCAFFIGCGIMLLCGIDIVWDEKARRFAVKRLGITYDRAGHGSPFGH